MNQMGPHPLIAVDVGNARTKLGLFSCAANEALPKPSRLVQVDNAAGDSNGLAAWVESLGAEPVAWWIGSVNRPAAASLMDWLHKHRPDDAIVMLTAAHLPLHVELARPDCVGIDRLLDAIAANRLRSPGRPAVVVDAGTAITVDFVSADGVFRGGSILPGISLSARALHEFTDQLPLVETSEWTGPPAAVGASTEQAIASGLFWGAVGAIRELIAQMTAALAADAGGRTVVPDIFLSGGGAEAIVDALGGVAQFIPELTLAGIALTAQAAMANPRPGEPV